MKIELNPEHAGLRQLIDVPTDVPFQLPQGEDVYMRCRYDSNNQTITVLNLRSGNTFDYRYSKSVRPGKFKVVFDGGGMS